MNLNNGLPSFYMVNAASKASLEERVARIEGILEYLFLDFVKKLYPSYKDNYHSAAVLTVLHEKHRGRDNAVESFDLAKEMKARLRTLFAEVPVGKISFGNIFADPLS